MTDNGRKLSISVHVPETVQDLLDEAVALHDAGDLGEAEPLFRGILRQDPGHPRALYHLGTIELQRDNVLAGLPLLERAAQAEPPIAELFNNLGLCYQAQGNWGDAAQAFENALRIDSRCAAAYFNLADLAESLEQFDTALQFYRQALQIDPGDRETVLRLARLQLRRQAWDQAETWLMRALELADAAGDGDVAAQVELLGQLGVSQVRQRKFAAALETFQQALALCPDMPELHSNLGYVLERVGRVDEAIAAVRQALALQPDLAEAYNTLGICLRSRHDLSEAQAAFEQALALQPTLHLARFNLGATHLMAGRYDAGWAGYEYRDWIQAPAARPAPVFSFPVWNGQPLPGQTLLVYSDQGYGDAIQFARLIPQVPAIAQGDVVVACHAPLVPLFQGLPGITRCLPREGQIPACDAQIALSSLPALFGLTVESIPAGVPYLTVAEDVVLRWRDTLGRLAAAQSPTSAGQEFDARRPFRVGLVWQGNPEQDQDHVRSAPLSSFAGLMQTPGVQWFSLQKGTAAEAALTAWPQRRSVVQLAPLLHDFAETAGAIRALDLVISVDTAVAHLAGALGCPCWTLLCQTPDWRWMLDRSDSPWYPSLRLFRQPAWGDWDSVMAEVSAALREAVGGRLASGDAA